MTSEREAYLAKCSKKELVLRHWIELQNVNIKVCKADFAKNPTKARRLLQTMKYELVVYRHELQCLKGMDRVVVPRDLTVNKKIVGMYFCNVAYGVCVCGEHLVSIEHNFCPKCGRKILWERVK